MIARLILILLLACLALPAMATAPCHDGSGEMAGMAMPHAMPAPVDEHEHERKAMAVHACMGCIPPTTLLRAPLAEPLPLVALPPVRGLMRFDRGRMAPPATPPPRADA